MMAVEFEMLDMIHQYHKAYNIHPWGAIFNPNILASLLQLGYVDIIRSQIYLTDHGEKFCAEYDEAQNRRLRIVDET